MTLRKTDLVENPSSRKRPARRARLAVAAAIIALAALAVGFWPRGGENLPGTTYTVRKMDLRISVLEGGSLISHEALEIKSQVEGQTSIISIVPDGTLVTEEDVRNGKVLIELDSSRLREQLDQQEITVQSATAGYTQAREAYAIQKNRNESNIKAGELKGKFAKMDLQKFLGKVLAGKVLAGGAELSALAAGEDWQALPKRLEALELGGTGLQELDKLRANIDLAAEEVTRAKDDLDWSKRLGPKEQGGSGYITGSELEADRLAWTRRKVELEQARRALQIFLKYELPKQAEQLLSDYVEAGKELERIKAQARAELAQAEATLKSKEATFKRQTARLHKLREQIAHCTIRAARPGMVVYASTGHRWRRATIEEGAAVRERQRIITLPGPTNMAVEVKVHESAVRKVKPGMKARIVPDAFQERVIHGKVKSISVLPDSGNWMNPELKMYNTIITLDDPPTDLKPGMSAQVEILITMLRNVTAVPVQAVTSTGGRRVCYVARRGKAQTRPVETGESNDRFIEILNGLHPGEEVLLQPPAFVASAGPETPPAEGLPEVEAEPPGPPRDAASESSVTGPAAESLPADVQTMLNKLPAERRKRILERLETLTPEQQEEMLKQVRGRQGRPSGQRRERKDR